jgi:hypothetical protein
MSSYAASEAAKSDIATICSGSVTEDISGIEDMIKISASGSGLAPPLTICPIVLRRSVEFAPPHDMGPPISRALDFSSNSRTGSVKSSTGASHNSDVLTDGDHDCNHDGTHDDDCVSLSFHTLEPLVGESDDEASRNQPGDNYSDNFSHFLNQLMVEPVQVEQFTKEKVYGNIKVDT